MTKLFSSKVAIRTAEEAMQVPAGADYLAESEIQHRFCGTILHPIIEGTTEIQELVISREV